MFSSAIVSFLIFIKVQASFSASAAIDRCSEPFWSGIEESLRKGQRALMSGDAVHAMTFLNQSSIREIFGNPEIAFSCSLGSASLAIFLSDCYDKLGNKLRTLRLRNAATLYTSMALQTLGEQGIRTSGWPVTWSDTVSKSIDSMLWHTGADEYRTLSMADFISKTNMQLQAHAKLSIGIVTVCDYDDRTTPLKGLSRWSKSTYAGLHNYTLTFNEKSPIFQDFFAEHAGISQNRPHAWGKIDALLEVMSSPSDDSDWIMWMDCDSFFMDYAIKLDHVVQSVVGPEVMNLQEKNRTKNAIKQLREWIPIERLPFDEAISEFSNLSKTLMSNDSGSIHLIASEDGLMLNTGLFLIRKSITSYNLLWKVRQLLFNNSLITFHPWWEQTALVMLLSTRYLVDDTTWNSVRSNKGFPSFVKLLSQKQLNGYPPLIAGMLNTHAPYETGDFVVSFSGCKTYTSQEVCNSMLVNYIRQSEMALRGTNRSPNFS
jgi:hypothetical protein